MILWLIVARLTPLPYHWYAISALILLAVGLGIPAGTLEANASGRKDPSQVVIDEVAGQLITLAGAPVTFFPMLIGFILFRAFDIVKPPPVRQIEKLPGGTGIMMDDVGAGIYGWIVLQLLLHFGIVR